MRVPQSIIDEALANLDPKVVGALEESITRVRKVHAEQVPAEHTAQLPPGGTVTEVFLPVERVGLYVPGGNAVYPSTVIMNVVPAQEAGVGTLVVASPAAGRPRRMATPHNFGCSEAAGRGRGVGNRRRTGRGVVGLRR